MSAIRHSYSETVFSTAAAVVLSALFVALFSTSTSPLFSTDGGDSVIYRMLGLGILHGRMPYVDIFDNKGLLLYLIEALGQWMLPGRCGIFLLQVLSLSVTMVFSYRTLRLMLPVRKAVWAALAALFLLGGCYQGGNRVEEYELPFLAIAFYYGLQCVAQNGESRKSVCRHLAIGLCFGALVLLRPNDAIGMVGGMTLGLALMGIYNHDYKTVVADIMAFSLAALLMFLPVAICYRNHLDSLWQGMVGINGSVSGGMLGQISTLLKWAKWAILLLMFVLAVMLWYSDRKSLLWVLVPAGMLQLFFVGGKMYAHYLMPLFPLLLLYVALLFVQRNRPVLLLAVAILCLSHRPLPRMAILNAAESIKAMGHRDTVGSTVCPIPYSERMSVWNHSLDPWREGAPMAWLVDNGISQCNRQAFSLNEYVEELDFDATAPLWVASCNDEFEQLAARTDYQPMAQISYNGVDIRLYRRL